MSFNPNKLTFKVDEITGEIIQPQVFLCDRQLNTIGEIYPVGDLRIKCVLNGADEISFSTPKNVSGHENPLYHKIKDYSVVFVRGFGYFEVSPTVNDTYTSIKTMNGNSLGESELSQLFCTLECNTNSDMEDFGKLHPTEPYISTVLYSDKAEQSLIHRILTYAPNYTVGTVDDTIKNIQRTFSFSRKDIISCFSEIAQEIGCIFDIVVRKNEDGVVERTVNIYDAQYCKDCRRRNIINGVCQGCGSTNIGGIGEDTNITVGTDNLSDEITLAPDGNMKNCFIIEGGDDIITDTVEGILPSGNKKLYMFSPETKQLFSPKLQEKYDNYLTQFNKSREPYEKLLQIEYGILDLVLYLQSGRMPTPETPDTPDDTVDGTDSVLKREVTHIIQTYSTLFPNGLGHTDNSDTISRNGIVRQVLSLFVHDGYMIRQENGNYDKEKLRWTGDILVYEIRNNSSQAIIHVSDNSSTIEYSDKDKQDTSSFCIKFSEDYTTYLKQMVAITTKNYEFIEEQGLNQPKEWQKYSLHRLYSYESGYQACIETLEEIICKSDTSAIVDKAKLIKEKYYNRKIEISDYMTRLEDIIFHLCSYFGNFNIIPSSVKSEPTIFATGNSAFLNMVHYIRHGTWAGESENEITDHPIYCKNCGSKNVTLTGCNQCKTANIATYSELAQTVYENYMLNHTPLETQRKQIRENNDLRKFLKDPKTKEDLYPELCSFIREDVYTNSNFISDGLSNSELIQKSRELVQKAEQELAKACISQHTLSGNIYSFAAYSHLSKEDFPISGVYDGFKLGNFMRYFADDGKTYKLRLSSEEFSWTDSGAELNVEFTDVIEYSNGGISDLASLMQTMGSLATSFDSVKKQAEQGVEANHTFQKIKDEGLQSALSNVLNARDIDVQIDENGILLRKYDHELDDYDQYQMKLINRNIVMTKNNWKNASMAIGLGRYNGELVYGVWADVLVGDLIVGKELVIKNKNENGDSSVTIDKNGITIKNGSILWEHVNAPGINEITGLSEELSSIPGKIAKLDQKVAQYLTGGAATTIDEDYMISPYIGGGYLNIISGDNQVIIDPSNTSNPDYIFQVKKQDKIMVGISSDGEALFQGEIRAQKGTIGGWIIDNMSIYKSHLNGEYPRYDFSIDSEESKIVARKIKKVPRINSSGDEYNLFYDNILKISPGRFEYLDRIVDDEYGDIIKESSLFYIEDGGLNITYHFGTTSVRPSNKIYISALGMYLYDNDPIDNKLNLTVRVESSGIYVRNKHSTDRLKDHGINFLRGFEEYGKPLKELYSVVKSGENNLINKDANTVPWIQQTADFGVVYESEPLVSVMFYGTNPVPDHENIVFDSYEINSNGGYIGFKYWVRTKNPDINYLTKWWAVGNVKP